MAKYLKVTISKSEKHVVHVQRKRKGFSRGNKFCSCLTTEIWKTNQVRCPFRRSLHGVSENLWIIRPVKPPHINKENGRNRDVKNPTPTGKHRTFAFLLITPFNHRKVPRWNDIIIGQIFNLKKMVFFF